MARYIVRRVLLVVPILLGVSIVTFALMRLVPGSAADALLGPNPTPREQALLVHAFGLDKPVVIQYVDWLTQAVQGNFGLSIQLQLPVFGLVWHAFGNTLLLTAGALVVAIVGGIALGAIAALPGRSAVGRAANAVAVVSVSAPQYSVALVLMVLLAVDTNVFPSGGIHDSLGSSGALDVLHHLVLPAVAAGIVPMGVIARVFRVTVADSLGQDFLLSLRARGLSRMRIATHVFHNALPALLNILGLQIGYLLSGVIFIEQIFAWPGVGQLAYNAVTGNDYPIIEGTVLVGALVFVTINVIVDVAHAAIDPRVRARST